MARRVWWIDDYISTYAWVFGQGSGRTATRNAHAACPGISPGAGGTPTDPQPFTG